MNEEKNYCVYKHTCPNKKVYIGMTGNLAERWKRNGTGYSGQLFYRAILKYGWDNIKHEILEDNLTFKDACKKEIYYIKKYNSRNREYGYNIALGGQYTTLTKVKQYTIFGNFVCSYDSIVIAAKITGIDQSAISNAVNGLSKTAGGYLWTKFDEYLDNNKIPELSDLELTKINNIKIKQYDLSGNLLKIYDSLKEASVLCKIPQAIIYNVCIGKAYVAYNYVWRFENDNFSKYFNRFRISKSSKNSLKIYNQDNLKYSNIPIYQYNFDGTLNAIYKDIYDLVPYDDWRQYHIISCLYNKEDSCDGYVYRFKRDLEFEKNGYHRNCGENTRKICQFDFNKNLIMIYDSIADAQKETGALNIGECARGKRHHSGGFVWRYDGDSFDKYPLKRHYKTRPVCQYDIDKNFIKEYASISEAERELRITNISKGVKKICKTIGGYIWRYKEESD